MNAKHNLPKLLLIAAVSCAQAAPPQTTANSQTIPTFAATAVSGLGDAAGVSWMDFDGDGFLDLFVANGAGQFGENNSVYHNNGGGTFIQVLSGPIATDVGANITLAWGDYDNDGHPDLFVGKFSSAPDGEPNLFYQNQGGGVLTPITTGPLATTLGNFIGLWADYDNDGFLDIVMFDSPGTNLLFRNSADGTFTRVNGSALSFFNSQDNNVANGGAWADYDNDGYPDLFYFHGSGHNRLFHNNRDGTFAQVRGAPFDTDFAPSVGAAWGDYDNDGFLDLFVANGNFDSGPHRSFLYHNNGDGSFTKVTTGAIVTDNTSAVTAAWEDFDNDGHLDLFVSHNAYNGRPETQNALYHNNGDGTFTSLISSSLVSALDYFAGVAWGDYDNDGFPDIFVVGGQQSFLYHNGGNSNNWITFKLNGTVSNGSALGAKVKVQSTIGGQVVRQMRYISNGDGTAGNSLRPHFGLGDATQADLVRIEWPSGIVQELKNVPAKQILTLTEPPRLFVTVGTAAPRVNLKGGRGYNYDIQASSDLTTWSSVGSVTVTNLSGTAFIPTPDAQSSGGRFYRAVSQ